MNVIVALTFFILISAFEFQSASFACENFYAESSQSCEDSTKRISLNTLVKNVGTRGAKEISIDILKGDTWEMLQHRVQLKFGGIGILFLNENQVEHFGENFYEKISQSDLSFLTKKEKELRYCNIFDITPETREKYTVNSTKKIRLQTFVKNVGHTGEKLISITILEDDSWKTLQDRVQLKFGVSGILTLNGTHVEHFGQDFYEKISELDLSFLSKNQKELWFWNIKDIPPKSRSLFNK